MSELNHSFFERLAQKLPGLKKQYAEAAQKKRAAKNGHLTKPICSVCGAEFSVKATIVITAVIPKNCPTCQSALDDGCTAFVTLEKPARFWIGKGTKPELVGKVVVISKEHMDAILRIRERLDKAKEDETGTRPVAPPADA